MNLSPIVLFTYNRPEHTRKTIETLQKNDLAKDSDFFIFSDAPKNQDTADKVKEVREYIKTISGFKQVTIREEEKNRGLAESIIAGVTEIVNRYGKVIVMEDDMVISPYFLKFMNQALDFFKDEKKVWHISGWNYPIKTEGLGDIFFWRVMNCWGWATWADRWRYYQKNVGKTIEEFTREDIKKFNLNGSTNFWSQVRANKKGKLNTWAIFWYATIFKHDGLCLNPSQTLVKNIGNDSSGVHSHVNFDPFSKAVLSNKKEISLNESIEESKLAVKRVMRFYRSQRKFLLIRIFQVIRKLGIRKFLNEIF